MKSQKTNKTIKKKLEQTKTGKIMRRAINQGHFNAKDSGNETRAKRKKKLLPKTHSKQLKKVI